MLDHQNTPGDDERTAVIRDVPAVTRASALLKTLANAEGPLGVVALSREVGAIPSTCLHILRVLVDHGLAVFDARTKHYALGPGTLALASSFAHHNPFAQFAKPVLEELSHKHGLAFAAIERSDQEHLVVVAIGDVATGLAVRLRPGVRLPVVMSASGRCYAAFGGFSEADLRRRFAKLRWDHRPDVDQWIQQIDETRSLGYALDAGNYIIGVAVLAVPVFFEQGVIAGCLTGVDFKDRLVGERLHATIASMKNTAASLSQKLGGSHAL